MAPVAHSGGDEILGGALACISSCAGMVSRFFVRCVPLFHSLMLTPMLVLGVVLSNIPKESNGKGCGSWCNLAEVC